MPNPTATAAPLTATSVRVTFNEPMVNGSAEALDPASYTFATTTPDTIGVAASSLVWNSTTELDLTVTEMTEGGGYELTIDSAVVDVDEGLPVLDPVAFTGQGTKPQVSAAVALNSTKVRVTFNESMDSSGTELENPSNYQITPTTPGASAIFVEAAEIADVFDQVVELTTSEMKEGASYDVDVDTTGALRDAAYNPVDPAAASASFTGIGTAPLLARVEAVSETRVDVVFGEAMKDNADIRDPANYVWDLGLTTIAVLDFDNDTVKLVTSEQAEGVLYTLTIG